MLASKLDITLAVTIWRKLQD